VRRFAGPAARVEVGQPPERGVVNDGSSQILMSGRPLDGLPLSAQLAFLPIRRASLFAALLLALSSPVAAAQLTLTWVASDGAAQYVVEREQSLGSFTEIARTAAGVVSYVDSNVTAGSTYCYRVRAAGAIGYSDYSNIACGVATGTGGTIIDDFARPDSATLGNGWTTVSGTLMIEMGQARNAKVRTMHAAVQAGLVGATQYASASFASVDNGLEPRFGLLVWYKDPGNYYMCWRQIGGASFLRISKVVDGVRTTLKTVAVSNPIRDQFFTLGCHVQGSTLALTFNGAIKLETSDPTLSAGSVGLFISHSTTGTSLAHSHRADDFIARVE
jgi:hypothetical protein